MSPNGHSMSPNATSTTRHICSSQMEQNSSLQAENEALRRQLLEAQELLVKRNMQLATLEGEMQSLTKDEDWCSRKASLGSSNRGCSLSTARTSVLQSDSDTTGTVTNEGDSIPTPPIDYLSNNHYTPAFGLLVQQRRDVYSNKKDVKGNNTLPHFFGEKVKEWKSEATTAVETDLTSTPTTTTVTAAAPAEPVVKKTSSLIPSRLVERLWEAKFSDDYEHPSMSTLTIDTDLTSTPSMNDLVPPIAYSKSIPIVSPTHNDASNTSQPKESSLASTMATRTFDTITPFTSAFNYKRRKERTPIFYPAHNASAADTSDESQVSERLCPSSMASSAVYTTSDVSSSHHSHSKPPPRIPSKKTIERSFQKSKRLPREVELDTLEEATIQVKDYKLVDADSDEGVYTGSLSEESKMPHGKGFMVYDEYRSYNGDWKHGRWQGVGHMKSRVYDYNGEFRRDQRHGRGVLKYADGVYEGEFENDRKHGKGAVRFSDGSIYIGSWSHNVRQGKGEMHFPDGSNYHGYFRSDYYEGEGKYTWADGSMYFGQWKKGNMHGQGVHLHADGSTHHEGLFLHNKPVGGYQKKVMDKLEYKYTSTMVEI